MGCSVRGWGGGLGGHPCMSEQSSSPRECAGDGRVPPWVGAALLPHQTSATDPSGEPMHRPSAHPSLAPSLEAASVSPSVGLTHPSVLSL